MKIISVDRKWFLEDDENSTLSPVTEIFKTVLNEDLKNNKYSVSSSDDPGNFTILSVKDTCLEDHFMVRIIKLPEPETDPFIIIYNIKTRSLAEKLHGYLIKLQQSKVILSSESAIPPWAIEKIISLF